MGFEALADCVPFGELLPVVPVAVAVEGGAFGSMAFCWIVCSTACWNESAAIRLKNSRTLSPAHSEHTHTAI